MRQWKFFRHGRNMGPAPITYMQTPPPHPQKWPYFHEICAMCWNERKIIFAIFIFWIMVDFLLKIHQKIDQFWVKKGLYLLKLKIEKIIKLIFHSFQQITHVTWKLDHIWEGRGLHKCISLLGTGPDLETWLIVHVCYMYNNRIGGMLINNVLLTSRHQHFYWNTNNCLLSFI